MTKEQRKALVALRAELVRKRMEIKDNGALPEAVMAQYIVDEGADILTINDGGTNHRPDLETAWATADLVGMGSCSNWLDQVILPPDTGRSSACAMPRPRIKSCSSNSTTTWTITSRLFASKWLSEWRPSRTSIATLPLRSSPASSITRTGGPLFAPVVLSNYLVRKLDPSCP